MKAAIGKYFIGIGIAFLVGLLALPQLAQATQPTVMTVPWDAANPSAPHTTYPLDALNEVQIVMAATADWPATPNSFRAVWSFGDGSPDVTINPISNRYNISTLHQYPAGAAGGTTWTATVTVIDNVTGESASANYYVIQQANNLQSRVNVAIDHGLWYLHKTMYRTTSGVTPIGGWDGLAACGGFGNYACLSGIGAINASNIQAFEVMGHYENGPASDPYTDDVKRGLARMMQWLGSQATGPKSYSYVIPGSCAAPPCTLTFDGNANGRRAYESSNPPYESGMHMDAIVATGNPGGMAALGVVGIVGQTYLNIVQDMADYQNHCQYPHSYGGGWYYSCQGYNDNSISQWAAIGLIGGIRGFGIAPGTGAYPNIIKDANKVWMNNSDNADGHFGYQGPGTVWGPYATTPSAMVQLSMDGIGRGDPLWDKAETFYRNNFCNATSLGIFSAPRRYTYGLFSFTKSMLLHSPGGVLTPITLLHSSTAGVPDIDWYNAIGPESGGPAGAYLCDGVAQTIVKRQGGGAVGGGTPNPGNPQGGYWYGNAYCCGQEPFETSWSIIMLRRTVFVACVNNLTGRGTPSGRAPARIDLTWTGIGGAVSYNVLRGTAAGGPYVLIGNTTLPAYSDRVGLVNNTTYYYVLQPLNAAGGAICQSNQATVTIPLGR